MEKGKIILINGPSSAGKSSIAKEIQRQMEEPFWHVSSDQFIESKMLPGRKEMGGEFAWEVMRPQFFKAFHHCLPAIAECRNNLVVDHVIEFKEWLDEIVNLLDSFDVYFVGVSCDLSELQRREKLRGDRTLGEAKDHSSIVHTFCKYDFFIDSTSISPEEAARQIIIQWKNRSGNSISRQLSESIK